jgi:hypothetical protein
MQLFYVAQVLFVIRSQINGVMRDVIVPLPGARRQLHQRLSVAAE